MRSKAKLISFIVVAVFACISFIAYLTENSSNRSLKEKKVKAETELNGIKESFAKTQAALKKAEAELAELKGQIADVSKAKAEEEAKVQVLQEQIDLAVLRAKEGVQHTFIRQERKNRNLMDAQKEAHRLSIRAGFVDSKNGREVRIKGKGEDVAFPILKKDGKATGILEMKKDDEGKFNPVITRRLAPDYKSSKFLGDTKGRKGLQSYEYVHERD
jgi:predicted RNase H-like nuclease (RuvC/YqgF family)